MTTSSITPYFGQAWTLVVGYASPNGPVYETISTDAWEPEALRITFEVQSATVNSPWWYADISIYNLSTATIQAIIFNAAWVTLSAGFQTGPTLSGVIWDGPILQVLYDLENVVDQRITLHCQANPFVNSGGIVSFSIGKGSTQADLLSKAAKAINLPDISQTQGTLSPYAQQALDQKSYPRGNTVFGRIGNFTELISGDQFLQTFRDGYKMYMTDLGQPNVTPDPDFTFCPPNPLGNTPVPAGTTPTVIGTPRQTPQGVIFTVLLDPRLKIKLPFQVVSLVRTLPSQIAIAPDINSAGNVVTPLDADLTFFLSQVKHVGDSRGNDWYTEVTGYNPRYGQNLLNGIYSGQGGQ